MRPTAALIGIALATLACGPRDTPEQAQRRALKLVFEKQIAGLEEVEARAARGEVDVVTPLAIGVHESVIRQLLNAMLPQEAVVKGRLRIRLETAEVYFRFSRSVVDFHGRLTSTDFPSAFLEVRLAGGLDKVDLVEGRLLSRIKLYHFEIAGTSLGDLAHAAVEELVREHLPTIEQSIPAIEIPVHLDEAIAIPAFGDGTITMRAGRLPLKAGVSRILPLNERLWVLLDVEAGPWQAATEPQP